MFYVGQEVICVHVERVANPYHNRNPVVKGRVYTVLKIANPKVTTYGNQHIAVQPEKNPPLLWPAAWFRPLAKDKKTDITWAYQFLDVRQPISVPRQKEEV